MKLTLSMTLFLTMIPIFIAIICIPFWTRKTVSFGVTIPRNAYDHPDIRQMRRNYALISSIFALFVAIAFLVASFVGDELTAGILYPMLIILYIVGSAFIYLPFYQKMRELKEARPEWQTKSNIVTIDTSFRNQKLIYSNKWFIPSFIISFITIVVTLIGYDYLPNDIPTRYHFNGDVLATVPKSYRSALFLPILQIYMTLLFLFLNTVIKNAKQQIDSAEPEESLQRNIIFRRRWSLFTIVIGTGLIVLFTLLQFALIVPINQQFVAMMLIIFVAIVIIWALVLSFTTGQGGSRLKNGNTGKVTLEDGDVINRDDDNYWKFGVFYFNRKDPSIFIEKRFGIGWTNNWGHPFSWGIVIVIILLPIILILVIK
ncbi:MAG TPA: DUF5808 domain-containing protein [Cerasibacillus sp.]|uniref:DUF1648 domain-containing protein n=1 Tax=Cerasibacillus sp. TaxID=2498711 RepID=UPI002F3E3465